MPDQANVKDLEVFTQFRVAVLKFAQSASNALSNADSQIARSQSALDGEIRTHWTGQLRKRTEAVTKARDAVRQKKLYKDPAGRTPGAVEEEKILAKCVVAVTEAEAKLAAIRRWMPRLAKEADLYRSGVARLNNTLTSDVPKAVALLDRLSMSLEEYVQLETPGVETTDAAAMGVPGETMARAPGEEGATAAKTEGAGAASAEKQQGGEKKEGHDVSHG